MSVNYLNNKLVACCWLPILTTGVERTHDDLKDNWDADASYDFNDNDLDPSPRMTDDSENM